MEKVREKKGRGLTILLIVLVIVTGTALGAKIAGVKVFAITSPSMKPALGVGEAVVVVPTKLDKLAEGDIITYYINAKLQTATHRIVSLDTVHQTLVTKGDNNASSDGSPILYGNVVGKVVFSVPKLGYGLMYLATLPGKIIMGGLLLVFIIVLFSWGGDSKKKKPEGSTSDLGE